MDKPEELYSQTVNFGFGKKSLEGRICEEANDIVDHIRSLGDEVKIDSSLFALPVLNVLWNIVTGQSFRRDDDGIQELLDLNAFAFSSEIFTVAMHAPWIRHVLPSLSGYNKWLEGVDGTKDLFKIQIQEHEKTLNANNPRDFIDIYLIEMKMNPDPEFNFDQLVMLGHDLISAGSETVATTLNWIILYLTINPDLQEKCYQEIAQHVSDDALKETEMLN